jgi:Leucine-rich repeat (LRR) protein
MYLYQAPRRIAAALMLGLCLPLGACIHPYTVKLNDNVLFTPSEALRNAVTEDPGLQACLDQAMKRNEQTDPAAITLLACPGAGVETLAGIEALEKLEQLELSDNAIANLSPLLQLKNLRVLGLRNNRVGDIRPLADLPILRFLSLEGNDRIPCRQLDAFASKLGNTFGRPQSCIN